MKQKKKRKVEFNMEKRVYGVLGIASVMANWNADFSGYPKTTSKGDVFGSDKAFKYPMKKMWDDKGEKVLYIKSMISTKAKDGSIMFIPKTLNERYEQLFGNTDYSNAENVLKNLFSAIDVKNFGATFAEKGTNISITGAVQFGQGFNKYKESTPQEQQILSPFRDPGAAEKSKTKDEAKNSTLGTKIVSDEAHYFYPFSINPKAYKEYEKFGVTEGYTEDDYKKFKSAALTAATSFATNAKAGCENEMGIFVETEKEVYLPNLSEYVEFVKTDKESKNQIKIHCGEFINAMGDKIFNTEIHYNPYTTELISDIANVKFFNILTGEAL